jgi:glycosyltransferase involved in cell wall biosynthesis
MAIEVAKVLRDREINFNLKIVGDGIHFENCMNLIQKYQLSNYVEMAGLIEDMAGVYMNADLMIHTALYEGLPMVFIEANSYGIPIISSDCMPNNEILTDGKNGYIVKTSEPTNFAEVIESVVSEPSLYNKLSKYSIETSKEYGISSYVDNLTKIYKSPKEAKT